MNTQLIVNIMAVVAIVVLIAIIVTYPRRGLLSTASWLVVWGAVVSTRLAALSQSSRRGMAVSVRVFHRVGRGTDPVVQADL